MSSCSLLLGVFLLGQVNATNDRYGPVGQSQPPPATDAAAEATAGGLVDILETPQAESAGQAPRSHPRAGAPILTGQPVHHQATELQLRPTKQQHFVATTDRAAARLPISGSAAAAARGVAAESGARVEAFSDDARHAHTAARIAACRTADDVG